MEKGFYEVHRMKEYHAFKIVPHTLFDVAFHIPEERQFALEKRYFGRYPKHWHRSLELFMFQRQAVPSGVMERPAY